MAGMRAGGRNRAGASPRPACEASGGPWRFASVHVYRRNRPGGPALARLGPQGRSTRPRTFNYLYISRRIGLTFRPGVLPPSSCKPRFPLLASAKLLAEAIPSRKKNGRLRARPPSARAIPSAAVPGRFSLYIYRDMFSSDCRRCAWSSLPNAATRPWGRLSLQACSQSSP